MTPQGKLIINADDFGLNSLVNSRIIECFAQGYITSASVIVNMPGFQDVLKWFGQSRLSPRLGIHLNLDTGECLSNEFRSITGTSTLYRGSSYTCSTQRYLEAISIELDTQIKTMVKYIDITHIDSHHHLHIHWPIAKIVVKLAQKYAIQRVRIAGNLHYPDQVHKVLYRTLINRLYFDKYRAGIEYFGDLAAAVAKGLPPNAGVELMTHPGEEDDFRLLTSGAYRHFLEQHSHIHER